MTTKSKCYILKDRESGLYISLESLAQLEDDSSTEIKFNNIGYAIPFPEEMALLLQSNFPEGSILLEEIDSEMEKALSESRSLGDMLSTGYIDFHCEQILLKHPEYFLALNRAAEKMGFGQPTTTELFRFAMECSVTYLKDVSYISDRISILAREVAQVIASEKILEDDEEFLKNFILKQFLLGAEVLLSEAGEPSPNVGAP